MSKVLDRRYFDAQKQPSMTPARVIPASHQQMSQTNVHDILCQLVTSRWVRCGDMTSKWHHYGQWPSAKHLMLWRITCMHEIIILRPRIFLYPAKVFFVSMYTHAAQLGDAHHRKGHFSNVSESICEWPNPLILLTWWCDRNVEKKSPPSSRNSDPNSVFTFVSVFLLVILLVHTIYLAYWWFFCTRFVALVNICIMCMGDIK